MHQKSKLQAMGCDEAVTLDCLRDLYDFTYVPVAGDKNSIAVGMCYSVMAAVRATARELRVER